MDRFSDMQDDFFSNRKKFEIGGFDLVERYRLNFVIDIAPSNRNLLKCQTKRKLVFLMKLNPVRL